MKYKIYDNSINFSGNSTTLNRLSNLLYLERTKNNIGNLIGIHAYKFGKEVINRNINFILIICGTDINKDIYEEEKKYIIMTALKQARYIVVFNSYLLNKVISLGIDKNKVKLIKQSIEKPLLSDFNLRKKININPSRIYLMVGNLRKEKDPMFLANTFHWLYKKNNIVLVIIGKMIEKYSFPEGIIHIDGLNSSDIYSCMRQVSGLVNTSISEVISYSILEAMKLGCPVYARNNKGNRSIISHGLTGFLFEDSYEFVNCLRIEPHLIIGLAYNYMNFVHNTSLEKDKYLKLIV
jgi:glycosyltransferase involved in cell wall biosynthesis